MSKKAKPQDIKALRGIGHQLSPIVTIGGNGITPNLVEEVSRALHDHELIKILRANPEPNPKLSNLARFGF